MSAYMNDVSKSLSKLRGAESWQTGPYWKRVAYAVDQLGNTLLPRLWGPFGGYPDETISSALGKMVRRYGYVPWEWPVAKIVYFVLEKIDPGHCKRAIEDDEGCTTGGLDL